MNSNGNFKNHFCLKFKKLVTISMIYSSIVLQTKLSRVSQTVSFEEKDDNYYFPSDRALIFYPVENIQMYVRPNNLKRKGNQKSHRLYHFLLNCRVKNLGKTFINLKIKDY